MQKAEPQHNQAQNQTAAAQRKGASIVSPQGEQLAQLEAMAEASPQADRLAQLAAMANAGPQAAAQRRTMGMIHDGPRMTAQRHSVDAIQSSSPDAAQRVKAEEPRQAKVAQRAEAPAKRNDTGMPDSLKSGIESLSGMSMDNVRVHYNSSQPAQLNAHAYAQGTDIHVAPGQEQHLPHEAWHVVQQAQGRVRPTMQMKGDVPVNDDAGLEREADVMGEKAASVGVVVRKSIESDPIDLIRDPIDLIRPTMQMKTNITHTPGVRPYGLNGADVIVGVKMSALLDPFDPVKGTATGQGWDWMSALAAKHPDAGYLRGHLLNHDLGGNAIPANLYPITTEANGWHSVKVENSVKEMVGELVGNKEEKEKHEKNESNRTHVKYTVKVDETKGYEEAKFLCEWGKADDEGNYVETSKSEPIESKSTDVGKFGQQKIEGFKKYTLEDGWKHDAKIANLDVTKEDLDGRITVESSDLRKENDYEALLTATTYGSASTAVSAAERVNDPKIKRKLESYLGEEGMKVCKNLIDQSNKGSPEKKRKADAELRRWIIECQDGEYVDESDEEIEEEEYASDDEIEVGSLKKWKR